jgi:hypothetical protein
MVVDSESKSRIALGALAGVVAWIVGYALTYAAAIGDLRSNEQFESLEMAAEESLATEMVGFLFYNAHNVDANAPQYSVLQALEPSHNFIFADGGRTMALLVIPILVLSFAGAVIALYTKDAQRSLTDAALSGTVVVIGYLPMVVLGTFVFSIDLGQGAMTPDLLEAIGFAGTFYPLVFGAIGGVAAHFLARSRWDDSISEPSST